VAERAQAESRRLAGAMCVRHLVMAKLRDEVVRCCPAKLARDIMGSVHRPF